MRLGSLILLLLVHWTYAQTPALFRDCDAKTTLCYALSSCKGGGRDAGDADSLVRVAAADVSTLTLCKSGFELEFANDRTWSVTMALDDQRPTTKLELVVKNEKERAMADCTQPIDEDMYSASKEALAAANNCHAKIEAVEYKRITEPLADVFHLSYGASELCLVAELRGGEKPTFCTEPIKFDVFNPDCQTNDLIGSGCSADFAGICEPALEEDNVFSCPDKEKNTMFLNDKFHGIGQTVRCTKDGWRSLDFSTRPTGLFLMKSKVAPQCVSLCNDKFIRNTDGSEDSKPIVTDGVVTCNNRFLAPIVDGKYQTGKPITCSESKWTMNDGKLIKATNEFVEFKCANPLDQYMANDCSSALKTGPESCGKFNAKNIAKGILQCTVYYEEAMVIYNSRGYESIFFNIKTMELEGPSREVIGPIEEGQNPYCVHMCSDVPLSLICDDRPTCSQAKFLSLGTPNYKSKLTCEDADSIMVMNDKVQSGASMECEAGVWKLDGADVLTVADVMSTGKPLNVHCHQSCHESLVLSDCNGDASCKNAKLRADKTIDCGDDAYIIEASADNWFTRATKVEKILEDKVFHKLKCSNDGWIGDDKTDKPVVDFKVYPQNDITVNCRSKCSTKFLKCWNDPPKCPKMSSTEIKCAEDQFVWMDNKPSMQDLACDPKRGWKEAISGKFMADFATTTKFPIEIMCTDSCTQNLVVVDCAGNDNGCVKPKLADKKLTCAGDGRVIRVNNLIEHDHLTCSRDAWTGSQPGEITIPRATHDEKIKVACLSKCDHSFIKDSDCVAKNTCDGIKINGNELSCASPKNFIIANDLPSASSFSCDPTVGWTSKEGAKAGDFTNNELQVKAHCFRNCDQSRIADACKTGEQGCGKFTYTNDVLTCPAGYVLNVNDKDYFEEVQCEAAGFRSGTDSLMTFGIANTKDRLSVKCISKCNEKYVSLMCDQPPCTKPSLTGSELKCADPSDLLVLGSAPVLTSSLQCDPASGWKEGTAVIHDLTGTNVQVTATCRQFCNSDLVTDAAPVADQSKLITYAKGRPLKCRDAKNYRVSINEVDSGDVTCGSGGWTAADGKTPVKFTEESTGAVTAECRHKCDPRFVKQVCNEAATCSNAVYQDQKLSCTHPSELLVIDGKESLDALTCSDDGWSDGKGLVVDKKDTAVYTVQVQCVQLCHPDFITPKDGATPFVYTMGAPLTCSNNMEMLMVQDKGVYSDLLCGKDGWRSDDGELEVPFHGANHARKITAGCETNDCVSRDFATPCGGNTAIGTCVKPNHTAYTMSCEKPLSLVASMESLRYYEGIRCKDGHWYELRNKVPTVIPEGDETPMRFQCFGKECVKCGDLLSSSCDPNTDMNCFKPTHKQGGWNTYCSRYECDTGSRDGEWWRITETNGQPRYVNGSILCNENGLEYRDERGNSVQGTLDCIRKVPCGHSSVSPLNTKCDGLTVSCVENLLNPNANTPETVKCPAPNRLYHETAANQWEEGNSLKCAENGQWMMEVVSSGEKREIGKGERVICASGDPYIIPTTPEPIITTADPSLPCIGCRAAYRPSECDDGCTTVDDGLLTFATSKDGACVAKSSSGVFDLGGGERVYEELHCKFENGQYVWRTDEGAEVAQFAAHKSSPPFLAQASQLGIVAAIAVLLVLGIGGCVGLVVWYKKREEQKRIAGLTKGLEQKNDSIFDEISIDSVRTLRI